MAWSEVTTTEKELPHNPGEIIVINGAPKWRTEAVGHQLILDIVSVGRLESKGPEIGIASFVVMEQDDAFLDALGECLAVVIAEKIDQSPVLLLTVEVKGACLAHNVSTALRPLIGDRLAARRIVLRKGRKDYMQRDARVGGTEIVAPEISYFSITSPGEQLLIISPVDIEFLYRETRERGSRLVLTEDFLGGGGTVVAVHGLLSQLNQQLPLGTEMLNTVAVAGSDGTLYQNTFRKAGVVMGVIPQPFPVRLPTFRRENKLGPWQVNI